MNNPHLFAPTAEKALLRRAMEDPERILPRSIATELFHDGTNLKCWRAMVDLWVSGVKPALETLTDAEIRQYMEGVMETPAGLMPEDVAIKTMHEAWFRRRSMRQAEKIHELAQEGASMVEIQSCLDRVATETLTADSGPSLLSDMNAVFDFIEWRTANPTLLRGMPFGMTRLEQLMDGLVPGSVTIVGARPSVGKTAFMGTIALNIAMDKIPVYYMSLEMSRFNMKLRAVQQLCGFPAGSFRDTALTQHEGEALLRSMSKLSELRHFVVDDSKDCRNLRLLPTIARRAVQQYGAKVLFVDYLQLLDDPREKDMRLKVKAASGVLHSISREFNVAVVAAAQLNRSGGAAVYRRSQEEFEAPPPTLESLKESGAIEEDADQVILLHRDQAHNGHDVKAILAKNRNGATGEVSMIFDPEATRFREEPVF